MQKKGEKNSMIGVTGEKLSILQMWTLSVHGIHADWYTCDIHAENWDDLVLRMALISISQCWFILMALKIQYVTWDWRKKSEILFPRFYKHDKYRCYLQILSSSQVFSNHFICVCVSLRVCVTHLHSYSKRNISWHSPSSGEMGWKPMLNYDSDSFRILVADILGTWGLNNSQQFYRSL